MATFTPWLPGMKTTDDRLNGLIMEELMPWTDLAPTLGTYTANGLAGSPAPRMRIIEELGTVIWEFTGRINTSGITAATTVSIFTFGSSYRVAAERLFQAGGSNSTHFGVRLGFMTSGNLTVSVPTGAGNGLSGVHLDGVRIHFPQ